MGIRVTAVDNDPQLLNKISRLLKTMPDVEFCGAFEEAVAVVEYVKEHKIELVFTDIVMPDISGISLAGELKKLAHEPAVVLMSSIPGFSLEAWKIDAFAFIEKPYTGSQIRAVIDSYKQSGENSHD